MADERVEVIPEVPDPNSPAGKLAAAKEVFRAALAAHNIAPVAIDSIIKANDEALNQPTLNTANTQLGAAVKTNAEKLNSEIGRNAALTEDNKKQLNEALSNLQAAYAAQIHEAYALMINSAAANQQLNQFTGEGRGAEAPDVAEPGDFIGGVPGEGPARQSSGNLIDQLMNGEIHTIRDPKSNRCIKYDPDTDTLSADHPDLLVQATIAAGHTEFTFTEGEPHAVIAAAEKMIAAGISPTIDPSLLQKWKSETSEIESKSKSMWNKEYWLKSTPFVEARDGPKIDAINKVGAAMKANYSVTPPDNSLAANNAKVYQALEDKVNTAQVSKDENSEYQVAKRALKVFLESAYGRDQKPAWELSDQDTKDNLLASHLSREDTLSVRRAEFTTALTNRGIEPDEANNFFKSNTPLLKRGALATDMKATEVTLEFKKAPQKAEYFVAVADNAVAGNSKQANTAIQQMAKLSITEFSAQDRSAAAKKIFEKLAQHPDPKVAAQKMAEIVAPLIHNKGVTAAERKEIVDALRTAASNEPNLQQRIAQNNLINQVDGPHTSKSLASWVSRGVDTFRNLTNDEQRVNYLVNNVHNADLAKNVAKDASPAVIGAALAKHVEEFRGFSQQDPAAAEKYLQERVAPLLSVGTKEQQKGALEVLGAEMQAQMGDDVSNMQNGLKALEAIARKLDENPKQNKTAIEEIRVMRNGIQQEIMDNSPPLPDAPRAPR